MASSDQITLKEIANAIKTLGDENKRQFNNITFEIGKIKSSLTSVDDRTTRLENSMKWFGKRLDTLESGNNAEWTHTRGNETTSTPPPYPFSEIKNSQANSQKSAFLGERSKKFFIVSQMNTDRVLDVRGENTSAETEVISYKRKPGMCPNQLWYLDEGGIIHSALNGMVMDIKKNRFGPDVIVTRPYTGTPGQRWKFYDRKIMNDNSICIDIRGESNRNGASVIPWEYKGSANQHWDMHVPDYAEC